MGCLLAAALLFGVLGAALPPAHADVTFQVIYRLNQGARAGREGVNPESGLIFDQTGNLWGTTYYGPASAPQGGGGTVFEMTPDGRMLHQYNLNPAGWHYPPGPLVLDGSGFVYGLAATSAANAQGLSPSVVFRVQPGGVIHTFLTLDPTKAGFGSGGFAYRSGTLYGANIGAYGIPGGGRGGATKFWKIDIANGALTLIGGPRSTQAGASTWAYANAPALDRSGNIWATDAGDDFLAGGQSIGIAWQYNVTQGKWHLGLTEPISTTPSMPLGCNTGPTGTPLIAGDGSVFVAAVNNSQTDCGGSQNVGWLLKRGPAGQNTILRLFDPVTDGAPAGGVVSDGTGAVFGLTTSHFGGGGYGGIYCVSPSGAFKMLVTFAASLGTSGGVGELAWDGGHSFYGITDDLYAAQPSAVFKLTVGTDCAS